MPPTEAPPNPAPAAPPPPQAPEPVKVVTRRYGELDHTELVHLLDSLEGDQAKSRFRESIYISIIFYLALAWLLVYGPHYLFHAGSIVPSAQTMREKERLTQLDMQRDLAKLKALPPKPPPLALNRKAIDRLQEMQRTNQAEKALKAPAPAPSPTPAPAPAPAQTQTLAQAPPPPPLPSAPTPQPPRPAPSTAASSIPDAPRPNAAPQASPNPTIADAGRMAGPPRTGHATMSGPVARVGQQSAASGTEILSDTQGIDFTEYMKKLHRMVEAAWVPLIPEECSPPLSKEGWTLVRFTIEPNGVVSAMHLDGSSHDRAIDKAAWGAITSVGQFPPLPPGYKGSLELRGQFVISRSVDDLR